MWGSNTTQGAIEATLVSNSPAIPLPQQPSTDQSVLATQNPSPAPAPQAEQPKEQQQPEPDAIPIPLKQPPKQAQKNIPKPEQPPQPKAPPVRGSKYAQSTPQNRANYGEATPQMSRAMNTAQGPNNPVNVKGSDFGSLYPWYVDVIKRSVARNWYEREVQPSTPAGSRVYVSFNVSRDGTPGRPVIAQSSGSPTLDSSCLRAVQRTTGFGPLPAGYSQNSINVEYYCEYAGPNQ